MLLLQVPDQVESRARQAGDLREFAFEFLNVVFAEFAQAQSVGVTNGLGREDFGDGQEHNLRSVAVRAAGRSGDAQPNGGKPVFERFHSSLG